MLRAGWQILWRLVAFLVAWGALLTPFVLFLARPAGAPNSLAVQLGMDAAAASTVLAVTVLFTWLVDHLPLSAAGLTARRAVRDMLSGLLTGATWLAAVLGLLALAGALGLPAAPAPPPATALGIALAGIALNAVLQEVLLRGYPYLLLERRAGPIAAVLITSVLFAALHGEVIGHWVPALNLFLAGVAFGVARWRSGSLALPVALHATWNALLGPVLGLTVSGQSPYPTGARLLEARGEAVWSGGGFGVEGGLAATMVTVGLVWWLARLRRD